MQTDKVRLSGDHEGRREALKQVEKFSAYLDLSKKETMRIQLLAEETLGMVETIAGSFVADFYLESTEDSKCRIHLMARTEMDSQKKQELIAASSKKQNSARKGFMGKIRDIIENGLYSVDEVGALQTEYGGGSLMYANMGMMDPEMLSAQSAVYAWSLKHYKDSLEREPGKKEEVSEAWDELEKSIVASIADDVSVSVRGDMVELTIEKKMVRS